MRTKAWKRNKSPKTNPNKPDRVSHNQAFGVASRGRGMPRKNMDNIINRKNANKSRMRFKERLPIRFAASSKENAVIVQQTAVARAISSPKFFTKAQYHKQKVSATPASEKAAAMIILPAGGYAEIRIYFVDKITKLR